MESREKCFEDLSLVEQQQALATAEAILRELLVRVTVEQREVKERANRDAARKLEKPSWGDATLN